MGRVVLRVGFRVARVRCGGGIPPAVASFPASPALLGLRSRSSRGMPFFRGLAVLSALYKENMRKQPPRVGIFPASGLRPSPLRDSVFEGAASVPSLRGRASGSRYDAGLAWSVCACSSVLGLLFVCACVVARHASPGCPLVFRGCAVAALGLWSDVSRRGREVARLSARGRKNAEILPSSGRFRLFSVCLSVAVAWSLRTRGGAAAPHPRGGGARSAPINLTIENTITRFSVQINYI